MTVFFRQGKDLGNLLLLTQSMDHIRIIIENPDKKENGCSRLLLNGKEMQDSYLPFDLLEQENEIIYTL